MSSEPEDIKFKKESFKQTSDDRSEASKTTRQTKEGAKSSQEKKDERKGQRLEIIKWSLFVSACFLIAVVILSIWYEREVLKIFTITLSSIVTTLIGAVIGSSIE